MKRIRIATIILFFALLLLPLLKFSFGENIVSEIDNRVLAENPFGKNTEIDWEKGISGMLEEYVSDRIGFRSDMIRIYTQLNDKLFGVMVHPIYTYGKDGYVFFRNAGGGPVCREYDQIFADMVVRLQRYCDERDVPFLFVFNPIKNAVMQDKLAAGVNFNNEWKEEFFAILEENGVRYVDNTELLTRKTEEGEVVFNQKYNAGHWNDLGAFYGVNSMLSALESDFPALEPNRTDEFLVEEKLNTSLMVSEFPIHEYEPLFTMKGEVEDLTDTYTDEVARNSQYRYFRYVVNEEQLQKGAPRTLVFQGSYMISMGYKFLDNRLGEYIAVHDYQNITNFDYYFNLFQPECVIFEVGEYVFSNEYFYYKDMQAAQMNPLLSDFDGLPETTGALQTDQVSYAVGNALTTITVTDLPENTDYAYAVIDGTVYDLHRGEAAYTLTVMNGISQDLTIVAVSEADQMKFVFIK